MSLGHLQTKWHCCIVKLAMIQYILLNLVLTLSNNCIINIRHRLNHCKLIFPWSIQTSTEPGTHHITSLTDQHLTLSAYNLDFHLNNLIFPSVLKDLSQKYLGKSTKPESKEDQTNKEYEGWVQELQTQYFFSATHFLNTDFKEEANLSSFLLDVLKRI